MTILGTKTVSNVWRRAYYDSLCELETSLRDKKIEIARVAILSDIENVVPARHSPKYNTEIRIALNVLNSIGSGRAVEKISRRIPASTSPKKLSN